ncbi:TRAP-type C4-dicarboxylate transport system, small permease component [Palleronia salina]|uniref:TRAP transporter small permease protein n=1 Tax=Palleronia salina TaxID=313368 RepID=A0A1M6JSR9_9RHOB|nr:TRAP transporter small permease [Palleronia salina]SHJ49795.1 TRAP-type C4-dicarboxylate transport system, small permease component [Palleronia salina]
MSDNTGDSGAHRDGGQDQGSPSAETGRRGAGAVLWSIYDRLETVLTLVALSATILTVLIAAVGRTAGMPVRSAPQLALLFLIWAIILGADICLKKGEHIRVSVIADSVPNALRRILAALHLLLIVPFLVFLAWYGFDLAAGNWQRQLGATGLSYGLITLALPVGSLLFLVSIARRFFSYGLDATLEPQDHHLESPL